MSTATKTKWFYKAQAEVAEELGKRGYKNIVCNWQIVTKDRVIEHYCCYKPDAQEPDTIIVTLSKHGRYRIGAYIHKVEATQGWHVSP